MQATPKRRPGRPPDKTLQSRRREEILDAAAPVFAEYGYPNTDVQFIADALQVGKGTIYRYFPSKQDLFLAAVDRGMQRLRQATDAATAVADPLEALERGITAYLAFFRDHPQYTELLIQERAEFKDRKKQTYFVHREANIGKWRDFFADLIVRGRVREVPVERILDVVGDLVYGTMFTNYFAGRHKPLEAQVRDVLDVLFHGILSEKERIERREQRAENCQPRAGQRPRSR
jgi:AcrR family transcriptional regulator